MSVELAICIIRHRGKSVVDDTTVNAIESLLNLLYLTDLLTENAAEVHAFTEMAKLPIATLIAAAQKSLQTLEKG